MPPSEARAMLLLLALAVVGQGVRQFLTRPGEPPGQVQLLATLPAGSPLAQRDSAMRQAKPLGSGERINVDLAPVSELTRLPRVGPRLAKVIVAEREAHGPFGGLAGLDRVAGVGPGLLHQLAPHLAFGGTGAGSPAAAAPRTNPDRVSLNHATTSELDALPGVGPSKAAAILQYRERHGRFGSVEELERVPGFGPAAVLRLRDRLTVQ